MIRRRAAIQIQQFLLSSEKLFTLYKSQRFFDLTPTYILSSDYLELLCMKVLQMIPEEAQEYSPHQYKWHTERFE